MYSRIALADTARRRRFDAQGTIVEDEHMAPASAHSDLIGGSQAGGFLLVDKVPGVRAPG